MDDTAKSADAPTGEDGYPRPAYAWYVLALLILAYVIAFIDRGILALLIEPIKQDLDLTDVQMSWLLGPAFGIFYITLGVPVGYLADRYSRRNIIMAGIAFWSLATAACGLARDFAQLFAARILVGVGEATLTPSALSLISDYFSRQRAIRAVGLFTMGQSIGAGLAFLLGGQVIALVSQSSTVSWPLLGVLAPWQMTFILVGLPGVLVALLMLTIREPLRRGYQGARPAPGSLGRALGFLRSRIGTFGSLMIGNSVVTIIGYSYFWIPSMLARTWGLDGATAGIWYGTVLAVFGPLGVISGARLSEVLYRRGHSDAPYRVLTWSLLGGLPFAVAMPLMPSAWLTIVVLSPAMFALAMASATSSAAVVHVAPAEFRAQLSAAHILVISLAGLFLGPTSVAMVTDYVLRDESLIRYSMASVTAVVGGLGLLVLLAGSAAYRRSATDADAWHRSRPAPGAAA